MATLFTSASGIRISHADPFDHTAFTTILSTHVEDGRVDYGALKHSPDSLKEYLDSMAGIDPARFDSWTQPEQLALLINLYNAATLQLIIDHYPVDSIKDIGTFLKGPWKQDAVHLWGETITLDELEHNIIRKRYPDIPEIHFALVCAAKGCPPLRSEAYVPVELNEQLAEQRSIFFSDKNRNYIDDEKKKIYVSPIFKWYGSDFVNNAGSVQNYLKSVWPQIDSEYTIRYTYYDWSLNSQ